MIETYKSENGLRIVLESVPTVRSVTIGIWVLAGSRQETEEMNGISHFLEHMLFKGTKNRTAKEIAEAFASVGGQVNAFTSKEYTCFYARVLDTYKEHAIEILTDMLFHSTFPEEEIEREKKVVMEEIKMYDDTPDDHVHDVLAKASFGSHPLGRTIIGTDKKIKSFKRQTLYDYMESSYIPENIVVSIAGNADVNFVHKVGELFRSLNREGKSVKHEKPIFQANKIIEHKETEQAHVCFGYEGLAINDSRLPALLITSSVLGGGMSSRLFQEVREKHGLAYSVFSYHTAYLDSGLLTIYAGTNKEQLNLLQTTIHETINNLVESGLTDREFTNIKEQLKGNIMLSLESMNSRMSRNGRNELLLGKQRTLDEIIEEIDAVDIMMVNKVIEKVFTKDYSQAMILPK